MILSLTSCEPHWTNTFLVVAIAMLAAIQDLMTFMVEVLHQSSQPVQRATSGFALLMTSHCLRAIFKAESAASRIDRACSLTVRPIEAAESLLGLVESDTSELNSS